MKEFQLVRRQPVALGFRPAGGPPAFDVEAVERVAGLGGRSPQQMDAVSPGAVEARKRCSDDGSAHRPTLTARRRCVSCSTRSASLVYSTDGVLAPPRHRRRAYVWPASSPNWELAPSVARCHRSTSASSHDTALLWRAVFRGPDLDSNRTDTPKARDFLTSQGVAVP